MSNKKDWLFNFGASLNKFFLTFTFSSLWLTRGMDIGLEVYQVFFTFTFSSPWWTMHYFFPTFTFSTLWLTRGMDIGSGCVPSAAIVQTERHWSDLRIDDHHSLTSTQASQCWSFKRKPQNSTLSFGLNKKSQNEPTTFLLDTLYKWENKVQCTVNQGL